MDSIISKNIKNNLGFALKTQDHTGQQTLNMPSIIGRNPPKTSNFRGIFDFNSSLFVPKIQIQPVSTGVFYTQGERKPGNILEEDNSHSLLGPLVRRLEAEQCDEIKADMTQ